MKVLVMDKAPFASLDPAKVAGYLQATGWARVVDRPGMLSIWRKPVPPEVMDALLPIDRTLSDWLPRMIEMVRAIAAVEDRCEVDVLIDLHLAKPSRE